MKNKKMIGQTCDCFFTGAVMLCKTHAAAPDLLESAKALFLYRGAGQIATKNAEDRLRAAIAKAEGS